MIYLYLAVFAVLGAFARYGQSQLVPLWTGASFPFATLSINVVGSLLMGLLFTWLVGRTRVSAELRTGMLTGGLGAYTTFSTYSLESQRLLAQGRWGAGASYMLGSIVLCVLASLIGAWLARRVGTR